jgi:hypothetical protein
MRDIPSQLIELLSKCTFATAPFERKTKSVDYHAHRPLRYNFPSFLDLLVSLHVAVET